MKESAEIFKKYFKTLYDKLEIEWTDENDLDMEKLSEALRREAIGIKVGDKVLVAKTRDGDNVIIR